MDTSVKGRVLSAAQQLLDEKFVSAITSRDIAQRAGVGLGSINYHFKSRDELLAQAALSRFRAAAESCRSADNSAANPKEALGQQIENMLRLVLRLGETGRFALRHRMTSRMFTAERHMLKYISQCYEGCVISPLELKLKALQISAVLAMALFNREQFFHYADIDLCEEHDTKRFVSALLNSVLIIPEGGKAYET